MNVAVMYLRAHPRVSGEGISASVAKNREEGSPPRERGGRRLRCERGIFRGLTPA